MTSIIIPTYNRAHLISRAIDSVLRQTLSTWELIIVDDGSTDNTYEVLQRYLSDPRIKYFKKANSGAAESRNFGVNKTTQRYITFLDSDDEAEPSWLEKMMEAALNNDAAVVCCGLSKFDNEGREVGIAMPYNMAPMFDNAEGRFTNGGVFLMLREIFIEIGGFDVELRSGQHTELSMRLVPYLKKHNLKIFNIFEPLIKVHVHEGPRIRYNADALYLGTTRTLAKHEELFMRDRRKYVDYLQLAGVNGVRTKRYNEAKKYFWRAVQLDQYKPRLWIRWIISNIPILRDRIWQTTIRN